MQSCRIVCPLNDNCSESLSLRACLLKPCHVSLTSD